APAAPEAAGLEEPPRRHGSRAESDTAGIDIFSGLDLDALWEEKLLSSLDPEPAAPEAVPQDIFADLDIESIWEAVKRSREAADSDRTPSAGPDEAEDPFGDIILRDRQEEDAADTAILPPETLRRVIQPPGGQSPVAGPAVPATEGAQPTTPDLEFLEETTGDTGARRKADAVVGGAAGSPAGSAGGGTDRMVAGGTASDADDFLSGLDMDALGPAVNVGVSAPVIGDGDIEPLEPMPEEAAPEAGPAPDDPDPDIAALRRKFHLPPSGAMARPVEDEEAPEPIGLEAVLAREKAKPAPVPARNAKPGGREKDGPAGSPLAALAALEELEFTDCGLDDEMEALLDEESPTAPPTPAGPETTDGQEKPAGPVRRLVALARKHGGGMLGRLPALECVAKAKDVIAWNENWWLYCDLAAAMVASASLAVIISYYFWYR
ncbi:MAG: hypothetical protein LIP77_04335, partial [Planctomycetes bacterium]|nr:hypothetical protein [Planctomycetota bacterium]